VYKTECSDYPISNASKIYFRARMLTERQFDFTAGQQKVV